MTAQVRHAFWGRSLVSVDWRKLCFVSYAVDAARLAAQLPVGISLDLHEGKAVVSLVAWDASYPNVFGIALPGHPSSTEIALRYHVCEGVRRGTVTVHEDSSSPFAALAARALLRAPMQHASMRSHLEQVDDELRCTYEIERGGRLHRVRVSAASRSEPSEPGSLAHFVEHRPYAYGRSARGELLRYDLDHPVWETYPVREHHVDVDFGLLYGPAWSWLTEERPLAVTLAEGSGVRTSLPE